MEKLISPSQKSEEDVTSNFIPTTSEKVSFLGL